MQNSNRKIIDLRKRKSQPLVIQRERKLRSNLLKLEKIPAQLTLTSKQFDLQRKPTTNREKLFLHAKSGKGNFGKFKFLATDRKSVV